jgi:hypothetical protein
MAESNGKLFRPNAEQARNPIMAQLVKEDERADRKQECDQDEP